MKRLGVACVLVIGGAVFARMVATPGAADPGASDRHPATGQLTHIRKHPWQVAINIEKDDENYLCSGAIISQRWVITAAHCLETSDDPANVTVTVMTDATEFPNDGVWSNIERTVVHPDYKSGVRENDLALIKLKVALKGHALLLPPAWLNIPDDEPLELIAWGVTGRDAPASAPLRKTVISYANPEACNDSRNFGGRVKATMFCAGGKEGGADSCQADSGGPLVWRTSEGPMVVGVASWSEGCARRLKYEVFTRVSAFRKWIDGAIGEQGS